ncbi:MAG: nicotinate-nucleotide adenylyltransferase [Acidaminococcaceae bacterium]|nr:nicotinate-nucleotide adenylyltransferase [Acidaminococcaceae bacterium]
MRPWGILGGSFDPIHNGHILLAQEVRDRLQLEKVIFIPAYVAPHKIGQSFASAADRFAMTALAVEGINDFSVSDMELRRGSVSYTVDTMLELRKMYPRQEFYFIIGADSVPQLKTWNRIEELFSLVKFAAVYRPGYEDVLDRAREDFGRQAERIVMVHTTEYDVSSTAIRQKVQAGQSISDMVPAAVAEYIEKNGLYR